MAAIFEVDNGRHDSAATKIGIGSADELADMLRPYRIEHTVDRPVFNEHIPNKGYNFAEHIVIVIDADEVNTMFPSPGYYRVIGLSPAVCRDLLSHRPERDGE